VTPLREVRVDLLRERALAAALLRLDLRDLAADGRQHRLALGEPSFDVRPLRRLRGDDLCLRTPCLCELRRTPLDGVASGDHPVQRARVLLRDPVCSLEALEQVVEALGAEQHGNGGVVAVRGVELDDALRKPGLGDAVVRTGDAEVPLVALDVALDPVELDVGEVVGLDHVREVGVDLLHLGEDVLRLGALRVQLGRVGGGSACCREGGDEDQEYRSGDAVTHSDVTSSVPNLRDDEGALVTSVGG
jgi:hypothetical protein